MYKQYCDKIPVIISQSIVCNNLCTFLSLIWHCNCQTATYDNVCSGCLGMYPFTVTTDNLILHEIIIQLSFNISIVTYRSITECVLTSCLEYKCHRYYYKMYKWLAVIVHAWMHASKHCKEKNGSVFYCAMYHAIGTL